MYNKIKIKDLNIFFCSWAIIFKHSHLDILVFLSNIILVIFAFNCVLDLTIRFIHNKKKRIKYNPDLHKIGEIFLFISLSILVFSIILFFINWTYV